MPCPGGNTQAFAGFEGKVFISVDDGLIFHPIGEVRNATLSIEQEAIDATSFDSENWMENIVGLKSWEMSLEALYIYEDTNGQAALESALFAGERLCWRLLPRVGDGNKGYEGTGFASSYEVEVPVDDVVSLSVDVTGVGALGTFTYEEE